jgi:hypothetical protein
LDRSSGHVPCAGKSELEEKGEPDPGVAGDLLGLAVSSRLRWRFEDKMRWRTARDACSRYQPPMRWRVVSGRRILCSRMGSRVGNVGWYWGVWGASMMTSMRNSTRTGAAMNRKVCSPLLSTQHRVMGCRRAGEPASFRKFRVAPRATYEPLGRYGPRYKGSQ